MVIAVDFDDTVRVKLTQRERGFGRATIKFREDK